MIFGLMAIARAIPTRCFIPPESWDGFLLSCLLDVQDQYIFDCVHVPLSLMPSAI